MSKGGERDPCGHTVSICSPTSPTRPPQSEGKDISPAFPDQKKLPWISGGEGGGRSESSSLGCLQIAPAWPGCPPSLLGQVIPVGSPRRSSQTHCSSPLCTQGLCTAFLPKIMEFAKIFSTPNPPARSYSSYLLSFFIFLIRSSTWDNSQFRTTK